MDAWRIKTVRTPEGVVAREIFATGERAWRLANDQRWHACADHKGPWVSVAFDRVPVRVRDAVEVFRTNEAAQAMDYHGDVDGDGALA